MSTALPLPSPSLSSPCSPPYSPPIILHPPSSYLMPISSLSLSSSSSTPLNHTLFFPSPLPTTPITLSSRSHVHCPTSALSTIILPLFTPLLPSHHPPSSYLMPISSLSLSSSSSTHHPPSSLPLSHAHLISISLIELFNASQPYSLLPFSTPNHPPLLSPLGLMSTALPIPSPRLSSPCSPPPLLYPPPIILPPHISCPSHLYLSHRALQRLSTILSSSLLHSQPPPITLSSRSHVHCPTYSLSTLILPLFTPPSSTPLPSSSLLISHAHLISISLIELFNASQPYSLLLLLYGQPSTFSSPLLYNYVITSPLLLSSLPPSHLMLTPIIIPSHSSTGI